MLDAMSNCRLCSSLDHRNYVEAWNEPLFESENFIVLPSLGALVEGWLLLIPKKHYLCIGAMPGSIASEFNMMKKHVSSVLMKCYGHVCIFEHGPAKSNHAIGCSVDHAHLHFVPLGFDLACAVDQFLPNDAMWSKAGLLECQDAFSHGYDYLYLEQPIGCGRLIGHDELGSQLFRRAIAAQIGMPEQFNWRENLQLPIVSATIAKMRLDGCAYTYLGQDEA